MQLVIEQGNRQLAAVNRPAHISDNFVTEGDISASQIEAIRLRADGRLLPADYDLLLFASATCLQRVTVHPD